jgi:CDP-glucose 4,6-dehydratase
MSYAQTYGLPVAITRCGNLYGGGDLNWNRIVPGTMRAVLRGQRPVIRSDGSPRRDYVYVLDIVDAYLTLAEAMREGALIGEAFNFGLDQPMSALEMVQRIIAVSPDPNLEPIVEGNAPHEIQQQYLNSDKAHRLLGWYAAHTLEQGLTETMRWYADHLRVPQAG